MKIYISGKISGLDLTYVENKFLESENKLLSIGFEVVNPYTLNKNKKCKQWNKCMLRCIKELFKCGAIYMQTDWIDSKGARIEHEIAKELNLIIFYQ